jgi:hypothetical protein
MGINEYQPLKILPARLWVISVIGPGFYAISLHMAQMYLGSFYTVVGGGGGYIKYTDAVPQLKLPV